MLVQDIMTRNVITISRNTSITEAQKIMKEHDFRRLPVVDKGRVVGLVTQDRLEQVKPRTAAPLLWQITYLVSHTNAGDVMRKKIVTVKPTDTVEYAVAKAQSSKVGSLLVIDKNKIVGICTTNDFFYKIVNTTLGLGEKGARILVTNGGNGKAIEKVISCINRLGIEITVVWIVPSSSEVKDVVIQLGIEEATGVINELAKIGYSASVRPR